MSQQHALFLAAALEKICSRSALTARRVSVFHKLHSKSQRCQHGVLANVVTARAALSPKRSLPAERVDGRLDVVGVRRFEVPLPRHLDELAPRKQPQRLHLLHYAHAT